MFTISVYVLVTNSSDIEGMYTYLMEEILVSTIGTTNNRLTNIQTIDHILIPCLQLKDAKKCSDTKQTLVIEITTLLDTNNFSLIAHVHIYFETLLPYFGTNKADG